MNRNRLVLVSAALLLSLTLGACSSILPISLSLVGGVAGWIFDSHVKSPDSDSTTPASPSVSPVAKPTT